MAYQPNIPIRANTILGNAQTTTADPQPLAIARNLAFDGSTLGKVPGAIRSTTGYATLAEADHDCAVMSTDALNTVLFVPGGLPRGFRTTSFQGGAGQVSYIGVNGAVIVNGTNRSLGPKASGYRCELENIGNDQWVIKGNKTDQILKWSVFGQENIRQGDTGTYVIVFPSLVDSYPAGITIVVSETGFASAGYDKTLIQALTEAVAVDPTHLSFNGTNTITIKPGAVNPFTFNVFAVPSYTETSDVDVVVTIASPSQGTIASGADTFTTTVLNTSKPTTPDLLFPPITLTVNGAVTSGHNIITVDSVAGVIVYGTVTGTNIPALTWVTAIDPDALTVTLSANTSGTVADNASLTFTPPGFHFNFSNADNITKDGSNNVAQAVDLIHGYHADQATGANKPVWTASSLNSLGGLTCSGSNWLRSTVAPLVNIFDAAAAKYTLFVVAKLTGAASGGYMGTEAISLRANATNDLAMAGDESAAEDMGLTSSLNTPLVWSYQSDGDAEGVRVNGQRLMIPVTLTAPLAAGTGRVLTVDDTSGLRKDMICMSSSGIGLNYARIESIDSDTQLTLYTGIFPKNTVQPGTEIRFASRHLGQNGNWGSDPRPARVSTEFALGSMPASPCGYIFTDGTGTVSTNGIQAVIYEVIGVPRLLNDQEFKGVCLYLANKWGVSTSQVTTAAATAGATRIQMGSVASIYKGQVLTATTGIAAYTTVLGVNPNTNVIKIDTPVLAAGVANGQSLTFTGPSFKKPALLDITQFRPIFRDDFTTELTLYNATTAPQGWIPYGGDKNNPINPGTPPYNGAYGSAGHGSSNNIGSESQWYLDITYDGWKKYSPFRIDNPRDAQSGELIITAKPATGEVANMIGYNPPDPGYDYTSGVLTQHSSRAQQYGYYEIRCKFPSQKGGWPAFWCTAMDGIWPPEIDFMEGNTATPGLQHEAGAIHSNANYVNVPSYNDAGAGAYGAVGQDSSSDYGLWGCEVAPDFITIYRNREFQWKTPTPQDLHTPMITIINLAVFGPAKTGPADHISDMELHIDYVSVYKRSLQTPTLTGATQAETTALLAAMTAQPDSTRIALINTMIEKMKLYRTSFGQRLWDALDFFYVLAAHNAQAARINWKNPTQVATPVGTPTFTVDKGYVGVFGTSYLDTNVNFSTAGYQLNGNLNHVGGSARLLTANSEALVQSGTNQSTTTYTFSPINNGAVRARNLSGPVLTSVGSGSITQGHFVSSRNYYHVVGHTNGLIAGATSLSYQVSPFYYNVLIPVSPLDNANLILANGAAQVSSAHGGTYLTPDDVDILYNVIIYPYMHALPNGGAL